MTDNRMASGWGRVVAALLAVVWLAMPTAAAGQRNVLLHGSMENAAGKVVGLYGYADMLTMEEVLLDEAVADSTGHFELGTYVNYPRLVFVQVEFYSQSFYIEAGRTYNMYVPAFDWDLNEQHNVFLDPVALPVEFMQLSPDELNLKLGRVDEVVDSFVSAKRVSFAPRFKPDRRMMDTLEALVASLGKEGDDVFVERYKAYTLAQMRFAMHTDSRSKLFSKYVDGQELRYYDEAYMRFFFNLMADCISPGMRRVPQWRLQHWVADGSMEVMMDSLGLDPLLRNEQVRELAVLEALKEMYFRGDYSRDGVLRMVERIGQESKFEDHRKLAKRLLRKLGGEAAEEETTPPPVPLKDVEGAEVTTDALQGKWLYVSFVRVGDPNCMAEVETMAHFCDSLYATFPHVEMVSVVCDREFQKMYHFLRNNRKASRYRWRWLHFNGQYRWLERVGVVSFPTFMVVDPQGRIRDAYAPKPASGYLFRGPWTAEAGHAKQ